MPRSTQIIPEHSYPNRTVVINDNTEVSRVVSSDSGGTNMLFVFASPKGRDGMQTIKNGAAGFLKEYGLGPFSLYGQPLLNAYAAAESGNATLHCLRVTAPNGKYAVTNIVLKYKVDTTSGKISAKLSAEPAPDGLSDLALLGDCYTVSDTPDAAGYIAVKLFSIAYMGKGVYGNNVRFRVVSNSGADKENGYKNYNLEVYINDGGLNRQEAFTVSFVEDAIFSGVSLFADAIINDTDPERGSTLIKIQSYADGFEKIYAAYKDANPNTILTINDFDPLLGINKYTKAAIENYELDTVTDGVAVLNSLAAIALAGGSDGDLDASKQKKNPTTANPDPRAKLLDELYGKAYGGEIDEYIGSKNRFPVNILLDADFSVTVKKQIAALAKKRKDCVAILDCGTIISTKQAPLTFVNANLGDVVEYIDCVEAYAGKVTDPYSGKVVTVTGTYRLASMYPNHFEAYNGKHIPLAGNVYGILTGFIKGSIYPIFDEDIESHSTLMDQMVDSRINFAKVNANQDVVRATQTTRQAKLSNLSELSNVFILLDIKRDCEKLCSNFEFNFSEASDIARFNAMAKDILANYAQSQVRSIGAKFDKNAWEAARGILHMYVEFVHKDLVKTCIIEIDVNRG